MLIFRDDSRTAVSLKPDLIKLRAKSISLDGDSEGLAELWIGSRSCRYHGDAEIVLYGNVTEMEETWVGRKMVHAGWRSVLELHGKEKKSWTHLNEHLFANNLPFHPIVIDSDIETQDSGISLHRFNTAGELKELKTFVTLSLGFDQVTDYFAEEEFNDDIILLFTSGLCSSDDPTYAAVFQVMPDSFRAAMANFFNLPEDTFGGSMSSYRLGRFAVMTRQGETPMVAAADWDHEDESQVFTDFTIDLRGAKSGFDMTVHIDLFMPEFEDITQASSSGAFQEMTTKIRYGPVKGMMTTPIITLADDVSTWENGDEIVVASTDFEQDLTETFHVVSCKECSTNQVKLDRVPNYLHWGRKDDRTGIDQRAEVGLLSRNVRITSELGEACQYAYTRNALSRFIKTQCSKFKI